MANFNPVNTSLNPPEGTRTVDVLTPTTPKPNTNIAREPSKEASNTESAPNTPTRHSFGGVLGQRPLPDEPLTPAQQTQDAPTDTPASLKRDSSHASTKSQEANVVKDVEMGDGDDDNGEDDGSDNDSVNSDSRPSKKKKGQRFFCTDFPPCQLSFTRSEHLARHIRYV